MAFILSGKVRGDKEVIRALSTAPGVFLRYMRAWLGDERARFVGGPDSKGKVRQGYRAILASRRLRRREGTWSKRMAHLFKGYIPPMPTRIGDLFLKAGAGLNRPNQMHKALWMLATGGSITSAKQMPVPVYKNLAEIGITKGFSGAKAFKRLIDKDRLIGIKKGGKVMYFDKEQRTKRGGLRRSGLLFVGVHGIRVPAMLTGKYDFFARWDQMVPAMITRGQGVIDRATMAVDRGKLD
jgi:hypothetical protein